MSKTVELMQEAANSIEGDTKVFIGASVGGDRNPDIVIGGDIRDQIFLMAYLTISIAAAAGENPKDVFREIRHAFRFLMKKLKGNTFAEITTYGRDLEGN